jgi:hypothetical protein
MKRMLVGAWVLVLAPALTGCSIVGTWQVDSFSPADATDMVPFHSITFDEGGTYNSTTSDGASTIGDYTWNGSTLGLTPKNGTTSSYAGALRLDGKFQLYPDGPMTTRYAVLKKHEAEVKPK